jgi:hypothetical protein
LTRFGGPAGFGAPSSGVSGAAAVAASARSAFGGVLDERLAGAVSGFVRRPRVTIPWPTVHRFVVIQ